MSLEDFLERNHRMIIVATMIITLFYLLLLEFNYVNNGEVINGSSWKYSTILIIAMMVSTGLSYQYLDTKTRMVIKEAPPTDYMEDLGGWLVKGKP